MKRVILYRHSKKGPDKLLTPEGILLAVAAGKACTEQVCSCVHGPLARTAQTMHCFIAGHLEHGHGFPSLWPSIMPNLGSDKLIAEMINDQFKENAAAGMSNFHALIAAHGEEPVKKWATAALMDVHRILFSTKDGETVAGFFHSPTVELAVWAILGYPNPKDMPEGITGLPEMGGIILSQDPKTNAITVGDIIPLPSLD